MLARRAWACLFAVLASAGPSVGCGGTTHHDEPVGPDPNGGTAGGTQAPSASAGEASGPDIPAVGGDASEPTTVGGSPGEATGGAGTDGQGGARTRPSAGRALCFDAGDCSGLDCQTFDQAVEGACSAACDAARPCKLGEICFGTATLEPLCLQPCQGAEDCAYGFDCVHYLDMATLCLPSSWTEIFMHGSG